MDQQIVAQFTVSVIDRTLWWLNTPATNRPQLSFHMETPRTHVQHHINGCKHVLHAMKSSTTQRYNLVSWEHIPMVSYSFWCCTSNHVIGLSHPPVSTVVPHNSEQNLCVMHRKPNIINLVRLVTHCSIFISWPMTRTSSTASQPFRIWKLSCTTHRWCTYSSRYWPHPVQTLSSSQARSH